MFKRVLAMPLRLRVTLFYVVLGLVMSLLFAWTVSLITEDYEGVLVEEILHSQAEDYSARLDHEPDTILPRSRRLSGYVRHPDGSGHVPDALAALAPGLHESHVKGQEKNIAVFDTDIGRMYFTIDLKDMERLEAHMQWILIVVVLLGTLVSALLGLILSGSVVRPVRRLADAVEHLSAEPVRTDLASALPKDALGHLGKAIDDYQARLVANQEAERAFFADASHELRTPIAVVRGATELLIDDADGLPALQPRLRRLDRGVRQLSELLDALLGLARRRTGPSQEVALRDWLSASLERADPVRDGILKLDVHGDNPRCLLPSHEAALVLNGIVRQLAPSGANGVLQATISGHEMALQLLAGQNDDAPADGSPASSSDRGLAMTLIGRLADHMGWQLDEDLPRRQVRIRLPAKSVVSSDNNLTLHEHDS